MIAHWVAFGVCMCAGSFIIGAVLYDQRRASPLPLFVAQAISLIAVGVMLGSSL